MPAGFYVRKGYRRLMEYAGWYEGRKVDISIAEQHYADHGAPRVNTSKRFSPKHFVLCFQWYLAQKKMGWTADFECVLFSCLTNGIKGHLADIGFGTCPAVSWQKSKMTEQYVERAGSGIPKSCPACWRFGRTEKNGRATGFPTVPWEPTRESSSSMRSRLLETNSVSTPKRNIPALTAAF